MFEEEKLNEARYFYGRMIAKQGDSTIFKYYLSAFLSAARSALQYLLREANQKPGGMKWYSEFVALSPVMRYLKDKRDTNIHQEPVHLKKGVIVHAPAAKVRVIGPETSSPEEKIQIQEQIGSIIFKAFSGQSLTTEERQLVEKCSFKHEDSGEGNVELIYRFGDWSGSEDVLTLCDHYLTKVVSLLTEGKIKNFIT